MTNARIPLRLLSAIALLAAAFPVLSPVLRPAAPFTVPSPVFSPAAAGAGKAAPAPVKIDESIRRGVEFIIRMQYIDGSWTKNVTGVAGYTALDALALVKAGIAHDHPAILKALNFISTRQVTRTYDLAVLVNLLAVVDPVKYESWIEACASRLIDTQRNGLWAYPTSVVDMSNSQYAALGLRAAAECGVGVHHKVWEDLLERVMARQDDDGGFGYRLGSKPTGSMTCAGLACLLICREQLTKQKRAVTAARSDKALEAGLEWMDRNFKADANPRPYEKPKYYRWTFYYLYGVERLGALAHRRTFGGRDWYNEGAAWLLKHQHGNGDWGSAYGEYLMNTPFALLFLTRATLSSYTRHEAATRIRGGTAKKDIVLGCDRKNPGHVWIASWSRKVADKYGIKDGKSAIRVEEVEYLSDGETIGVVTEDPTGGRITRFPFEYHFTENGDKTITAKVTCRSLGGTVRETFESAPLKLFVHDNLTGTDRRNMEEVRTNLAGGKHPAVEVSSAWSGNFAGARAVDGLQGTSWLSKKPEEDGAPWIRVIFEKPVYADLLKVTHALHDAFNKNEYGRATRVRLLINRGAQKVIADLGTEEGVKYAVPFRRTRVRDLTIEVLDRVKGTRQTACGFSEIELFLKKKEKNRKRK